MNGQWDSGRDRSCWTVLFVASWYVVKCSEKGFWSTGWSTSVYTGGACTGKTTIWLLAIHASGNWKLWECRIDSIVTKGFEGAAADSSDKGFNKKQVLEFLLWVTARGVLASRSTSVLEWGTSPSTSDTINDWSARLSLCRLGPDRVH